jgi:hypothetical protein
MNAKNFMKDCASRLKELSKLPNADKVIAKYERGLITLNEAVEELKSIEVEQIKLQNKINAGATVKYLYGMRLRGCSTSAQPDEGFICREDVDNLGDFKDWILRDYWDVISYNRVLSERERQHFSLDYLGYMVA